MPAGFELNVRKKRATLFALLDLLAGDDAVVSSEGQLQQMKVDQKLLVSERPSLQRTTITPVLDFISLRLEPALLPRIKHALSNGSVVHAQVERNGRLVLGAYDRLQHVWISAEIGTQALQDLIRRGLLWSYAAKDS